MASKSEPLRVDGSGRWAAAGWSGTRHANPFMLSQCKPNPLHPEDHRAFIVCQHFGCRSATQYM
jgi:hypothetical protein